MMENLKNAEENVWDQSLGTSHYEGKRNKGIFHFMLERSDINSQSSLKGNIRLLMWVRQFLRKTSKTKLDVAF